MTNNEMCEKCHCSKDAHVGSDNSFRCMACDECLGGIYTRPQKESYAGVKIDTSNIGSTANFVPKENKKEPSPLPIELQKVIEEFMDGLCPCSLCPCRWIVTTPEHSKRDCPHYTFAPEIDFIKDVLLSYGEERYEAGVFNANLSADPGEWKFTIKEIEEAKADGEAQGIRRAIEAIKDLRYHKLPDDYSREELDMINRAEKALQALLSPNE